MVLHIFAYFRRDYDQSCRSGMCVTGPHFGLSVDVQRDALPRGTYFWQGHPWHAQLRHDRHGWRECMREAGCRSRPYFRDVD